MQQASDPAAMTVCRLISDHTLSASVGVQFSAIHWVWRDSMRWCVITRCAESDGPVKGSEAEETKTCMTTLNAPRPTSRDGCALTLK